MRRAAFRYLGGKQKSADWIVGMFPAHDVYVEPFGGSAAVLLAKAAAPIEVYNDKDDEVVNFFRVLRSPEECGRLLHLLELTPYSETEMEQARQVDSTDPVERARAFVVCCQMGYCGNVPNRTGFHANGVVKRPPDARRWTEYPAFLREVVERWREHSPEVLCRDGLEVIRRYDSPATLFYVDPPYCESVRTSSMRYRHEFTKRNHEELLEALQRLKGRAVLSGYEHPLYDAALSGWYKESRRVVCLSGNVKTETVWLNFPPQGRLDFGKEVE